MITNMNNVCTCYALFIPFRLDTLLTRVYLEFVSTIKAAVIVKNNLDYCRYINNSSHFCKPCYNMIIKKKIAKFEFVNCINILPF